MSGVTSAGLPYPTAQDAVTDTDRYIRDLETASLTRIQNRPLVMKTLNVGTNAAGQATLSFPEFTLLRGLVIMTAYAGDNPLVCNALAFGGRDVIVGITVIHAGAGVGGSPLANNVVSCTLVAWGDPV